MFFSTLPNGRRLKRKIDKINKTRNKYTDYCKAITGDIDSFTKKMEEAHKEMLDAIAREQKESKSFERDHKIYTHQNEDDTEYDEEEDDEIDEDEEEDELDEMINNLQSNDNEKKDISYMFDEDVINSLMNDDPEEIEIDPYEIDENNEEENSSEESIDTKTTKSDEVSKDETKDTSNIKSKSKTTVTQKSEEKAKKDTNSNEIKITKYDILSNNIKNKKFTANPIFNKYNASVYASIELMKLPDASVNGVMSCLDKVSSLKLSNKKEGKDFCELSYNNEKFYYTFIANGNKTYLAATELNIPLTVIPHGDACLKIFNNLNLKSVAITDDKPYNKNGNNGKIFIAKGDGHNIIVAININASTKTANISLLNEDYLTTEQINELLS